MRDIRSTLQTRSATRVLLALNGALLLALALQWSPLAKVWAAPARTDRVPMGFVNPTDQRIDMINELRRISAKLDALTASMNGPIDVRVVQMPADAGD